MNIIQILYYYMSKNAKFNMSGYNLILSDKQEVGIIYKNIYYLNDCLKI